MLSPTPGDVAGAERSVEPDLNAFLAAYQSSTMRKLVFVARRPTATVSAMLAVRRLERLRIPAWRSPEGRAIRRYLDATYADLPARTPLHSVFAVLRIPGELSEYELGPSKQTLRRKVREAERRGITWKVVDDRRQRERLIRLGDARERTNPDPAYRNVAADNSEVIDHDNWLVAYDRSGDPLLVSVTPTEGTIGALRYFRTVTANDDASVARYVMTKVLVEHLHAQGVRFLVDTTPSLQLTHGLRHFQRMVGFRLMRLEVARDRSEPLPRRHRSRARPTPEAARRSERDVGPPFGNILDPAARATAPMLGGSATTRRLHSR